MEAAIDSESACSVLIDTAFSDSGVAVKCQHLAQAISDSLSLAKTNDREYLVSDEIIAELYPGGEGSCKAVGFQLPGYPPDMYFYLSTAITNYAVLECRTIKNRQKEVHYQVCPLVTEFDALPPRGKIRIERKRRKNPIIGVFQKMLKFAEALPDDSIVEMYAA
ncbi:MAG: hypothetical protein U0929_19315 [Planctomycetaceae bacterium]